MNLDKYLSIGFLLILVILCIAYNYYLFSAFAIGIYFIFQRTWYNLLILAGYFLILNLMEVDYNFLMLSSIFLLLIIIITNFLFKKSKSSTSGDDLDFSKLFGGGE
jgi:hypothetical protein